MRSQYIIIRDQICFSCINVWQVLREVLRTKEEGRGFQQLLRDLANLMTGKQCLIAVIALIQRNIRYVALYFVTIWQSTPGTPFINIHLGTIALHRSLVFRRKIHVSEVSMVCIIGARERDINSKKKQISKNRLQNCVDYEILWLKLRF